MPGILETFGIALEAVTNFNIYVLTPIMNQFSYLCCYNGNVQSLKDQVEKLNKRRSDLQLEVDRAKRNVEVIGSDVVEWMEEVGKISEKKERIIRDTDQAEQGCFFGICPNIKLRHRLSREAKETTEAAQGLLQRFDNQYARISYLAPVEPILTASMGIEVDSRKSKEDEIMEALKDANVYVIALCGMGGVGKTTMARKIESKVKEGNIFGEVVMTVVSRPLDLKNVQQGIARRLGLNLDEHDDTDVRAPRLHKRLKEAESVLIILDDVWEEFSLEKIGIPSRMTHQRCKIILTSRNQHVCKNIEDSAKIIQLDALPEKEAWNLFKEKAGESVVKAELQSIARDVARECQGLPLALVSVAAALRRSSVDSWKDALYQLKASRATNIQDFGKKVHVQLKWSYDQLENEDARYLFLLCSLFPEDYEIRLHVLVEYGLGLGIFGNTVNLEVARNRVHSLVEMLVNRFLLIQVDLIGNDFVSDYYMRYRVKMHDVVRDMAISIASRDKHVFMVMHDLEKWPKQDCYENYTCISLSSRHNIALPEKMYCPKLELLCLDTNGLEIQESSFDGMRGLKVLYACGLKTLPSSLSWATNLQSLFLVNCEFRILPNEIGELVNLEILRLRGSRIVMLPQEVRKLRNLRLLDLTSCYDLKNIPPGVLSDLVQLEELYMDTFSYWKGVDDTNASVAEVTSLINLTTLQLRVDILSINFLQYSGNWHKLRRYYVHINCFYHGDYRNFDRCIIIRLYKSYPWTDTIRILLDNAQAIKLLGSGSTEIAKKLSRQGYEKVEYLMLQQQDLEFLFDSNTWNLHDTSFLPRLTTLDLQNNDCLKEICRGQPPTGSFSNLTSIKLWWCHSLEFLFSFPIVTTLSKLDGNNIAIELPKLKRIDIQRCKMLKSFYTIESSRLPQQFFFDQKVMCRGLEWIFLDWCGIVNLFSYSIAGVMNNLKYLSLFRCEMLQEVIAKDKEEQTNSKVTLFPQLKELYLKSLPKIQQFCDMSHSVELPSLEVLEIKYCHDMKTFSQASNSSFFDEVTCSKLKHLKLESLDKNAPDLFGHKNSIGDFNGLETIHISDCEKLRTIFSTRMFRGLVNLRVLEVWRCPELQEVISKDEKESETNIAKETIFPQLQRLNLNTLPKLIKFCHIKNDLELPSLSDLSVIDCPVLETFPLGSLHLQSPVSIFAKNLGSVEGELSKENFQGQFLCNIQALNNKGKGIITSTIGDHHQAEQQPFFGQKVLCSGLKKIFLSGFKNVNLFSYSMSRVMQNLEYLYVSDCAILQEVIAKAEEERTNSKVTLFPRLKEMQLYSLRNMQQFCHMSHGVELPSLEVLRISDCGLMETFCRNQFNLTCSQTSDSSFFDEVTCKLVELELKCIVGATKLFGCKLSTGNFNGLETIKIVECQRLRSIFSPGMFRGLVNLNVLGVEECPELQEVISKDEKESETNIVKETIFPQLKTLYLYNLPKLITFCHIKNDLELPSLWYLSVQDCPMLETFSLGSLHLQSSVSIIANNLGSVEGELSNENFQSQFLYNTQAMNIEGKGTITSITGDRHHAEQQSFFGQKVLCSGLKSIFLSGFKGCHNLFSYSMPRVMHNLEHLDVSNCEILQEVIAKDEEERTNSKVTLFPRLKGMHLRSLRNMKQFCHMSHSVELPSLEVLEIIDCGLMETLCRNQFNLTCSQTSDSSFFDEVTCKLVELKLERVDGATKLFGCKLSTGNFNSLETIKIIECQRLRSIFSPGMFRGLVNLKVLEVLRCPELQEVISKDEKESETNTVKEIIFPQLETLTLYNLPKLIKFCHIKNDLELPSLSNLDVVDCPVLETFSLGSLHLQSSVSIFAKNLGSVEEVLSKENFQRQFLYNIQAMNNDGRGTITSTTADGNN